MTHLAAWFELTYFKHSALLNVIVTVLDITESSRVDVIVEKQTQFRAISLITFRLHPTESLKDHRLLYYLPMFIGSCRKLCTTVLNLLIFRRIYLLLCLRSEKATILQFSSSVNDFMGSMFKAAIAMCQNCHMSNLAPTKL